VPLERVEAQLFFELLSECYERKSIILNINIEFSRWVNIFNDEQMRGLSLTDSFITAIFFFFQGQV